MWFDCARRYATFSRPMARRMVSLARSMVPSCIAHSDTLHYVSVTGYRAQGTAICEYYRAQRAQQYVSIILRSAQQYVSSIVHCVG